MGKRARLLAGEPLCEVSKMDLDRAVERIAAIERPGDLPVAPELMRLMVDALAFRCGLSSRARA